MRRILESGSVAQSFGREIRKRRKPYHSARLVESNRRRNKYPSLKIDGTGSDGHTSVCHKMGIFIFQNLLPGMRERN